jgi:Transposase DDE domain
LRNILDPVHQQSFVPAFDAVFNRLDRSGVLGHLAFSERIGLLFSGDGVDYFSSEEISCQNCNHAHYTHEDGTERVVYSHKMFNVGIVHPTEHMFIPLNPEFMTPQDGAKKQDCEQNGAKRWLSSFRKRHKTIRATLLVDALHCNHEFLSMVLDHRFQFIASCKPGSCKTLYEWVNIARQGNDTTIVEHRKIIKGKSAFFRYEYLNNVPIRDTEDALRVNFISMCEIDPKTEKVLHRFEYVTSLTVKDSNVEQLILAGRKRWKVENEGNNTLKNQGYYFDHNYGHGKKHLSAVIATLILYSFLVHTILRLVGQDGITKVQEKCYARKKCIEILRSSMEFCRVGTWEELYAAALKALEKA